MARQIKNYTEEFKKQIVALKINGKSTSELAKEYNIAKSSISKWVKEYNTTGSFKAKDNRTNEENELLQLRKDYKQILIENDILKQAALIMGRK